MLIIYFCSGLPGAKVYFDVGPFEFHEHFFVVYTDCLLSNGHTGHNIQI